MRKPRKPVQGQPPRAKLAVSPVALGLPCLLALLSLPGCSGQHRIKEDPLLGGKTLPAATSASTQAKLAVPDIPEPTTTLSTAALAAADALPGGRPLSIGDTAATTDAASPAARQPLAANPGWSGQPDGNPPAAVQLRRPVPVIQAGTDPAKATAAAETKTTEQKAIAAPAAAASQVKTDDLDAQLKRRGVIRHTTSNTPNGVLFRAIVPDSVPGSYHIVEATAADYRSAVLAVLQKIDQQPR